MKIVPQPDRPSDGPEDSWAAELDAALDGGAGDPTAGSWRELRDDVRALAPAMSPAFRRQLEHRIAERVTRRGRAHIPRPRRNQARAGAAPKTSDSAGARQGTGRRGRLPGWLAPDARLRLGAMLATVVAVAAALLLVAPWRSGTPLRPVHANSFGASSSSAAGPALSSRATTEAAGGSAAERGPVGEGAAVREGTVAPATPGSSGRLQQLSASISLTSTPGGVQTASDRVARLAVNEGGFVQSSQVQERRGASGEAELRLELPSTRLTSALAALSRIAPVSAESQSSQDVTGALRVARERLGDARAERAALLAVLSHAATESQVEGLQRRLARLRGQIDSDGAEAQRISHRASMAEVEVTIVGNRNSVTTTGAKGTGMTLGRGLRDARHVLTVVLVVILIALAILLPLGLLLGGSALAHVAWRRRRREQALVDR